MNTNTKTATHIALVLLTVTLVLGVLAAPTAAQPVQDQQRIDRQVTGSGNVQSSTNIDHGLQTTTVAEDGQVTRTVERRGDAQHAGSPEQVQDTAPVRTTQARDTNVNTRDAREADAQRARTDARTTGTNGTGSPAFSQQASAQGEDAGITQELFVLVDNILGGSLGIQMTQESSATGGTNNSVAGAQTIQFGAAKPADVAVQQESTAVGGRTAVDQQYRVGVDGTTYRSRQASHGSGRTSLGQQFDSRQIQTGGQQPARQTTGAVRGGADRRTQAVTHNHAHGPGVHHGQQHQRSHTHRHQHQQQTTGSTAYPGAAGGAHQQPVQQQPQQQPVHQQSQQQPAHQQPQQQPQQGAVHGPSQAGPSGCYTHTHEHGWGTHHGEVHLGSHTHAHQHCPDNAGNQQGDNLHSQAGTGDGTGQSGPIPLEDSTCRHNHPHTGAHHGEYHMQEHHHYHSHC